MKTILCSALVILLCGCSVIHSQQPVGLTPKDISNEIEEWEGSWQMPDGSILSAFVMNASNGLIRVVGLDRDGDEVKKESFDIYLRDANEWTFVSMADQDSEDGLFAWGRIEREDSAILIWRPIFEKFKVLIANGTLLGTTNEYDCVLEPLSTNNYDIICSDSEDVLFEWDEPMVFWKISK